MSATTLRHVVERALGRHLDGFGAWFPAGFDWQELCNDTPAMLRRLLEAPDAAGSACDPAQGAGDPAQPDDEEHEEAEPEDEDVGSEDGRETLGLPDDVDLVEASEGAFAAAYIGALAGLALVVDDERDPDLLLEALVQPLAEDEEPRFDEAVAGSLGPVEGALAGREEAPDEDSLAGMAVTLVESAWPGVDVALGSVPVLASEEGLSAEARQVLGGVARVAAILAAFRWLALDDRPGQEPA
ncbi:MAG: hypothetical protein ACKOCB_03700 [Planctomycetia bacterium]